MGCDQAPKKKHDMGHSHLTLCWESRVERPVPHTTRGWTFCAHKTFLFIYSNKYLSTPTAAYKLEGPSRFVNVLKSQKPSEEGEHMDVIHRVWKAGDSPPSFSSGL